MQNCRKMPRIHFTGIFETALIFGLFSKLYIFFGSLSGKAEKKKYEKISKKIFAGESRGGKKG
jgi:hypothetical protein